MLFPLKNQIKLPFMIPSGIGSRTKPPSGQNALPAKAPLLLKPPFDKKNPPAKTPLQQKPLSDKNPPPAKNHRRQKLPSR